MGIGRGTRQQNAGVADIFKANGYTVVGGAGEKPEEWIPGPGGGTKGGTFIDITVRKGNETIRIQTVSTNKNGTLTPEEAAAAARIRARFPNDRLILIPKTPKPAPPPPPLIPQRPPDEVRAF